jgi:hypothetical protein
MAKKNAPRHDAPVAADAPATIEAPPRSTKKGADNSKSNVVVMHTMVGPFPKGHVLTQEELKEIGGKTALPRLINLGAVAYTDAAESQAPLPETLEAANLPRAQREAAANAPGADDDEEGDEGEEGDGDEDVTDEDDLNAMKKTDLVEKAAAMGIEKAHDMTKGELVEAIKEKQAE